MAVTKTMTKATPYETSGKAQEWHLEIKYENDSEGDATYYTNTFRHRSVAANGDFTAAAKGTFSKADLTALCPVSHWDTIFAEMVDSVITNPKVNPVPDRSFSVPS